MSRNPLRPSTWLTLSVFVVAGLLYSLVRPEDAPATVTEPTPMPVVIVTTTATAATSTSPPSLSGPTTSSP